MNLITRSLLAPAAVLLAFFAFEVHAQEQETPVEPDAGVIVDEFDRGTPRRSLVGYLTAAQERDFEVAAEYLDLRNLPAAAGAIEGPLLAQALAVVIERELWIDFDEISDHPDGAVGDGLPSYRDQFAELPIGDDTVSLFVQRVPRGDGEFIWKISNRTVGDIPALYDEYGYGPVEKWLFDRLPDITILNIELFKWVIALGAGVLSFAVFYVLLRLLSNLIARNNPTIQQMVRRFLTRPFLWLMVIMVTNQVTYSLGLGIEAQRFADAHTFDTAIMTWVLLSATNLMRAILRVRLDKQGKDGAIVLLGPIGNAIKITIVLLAILTWLSNLGFNITALLAGLGVGGIAIALALQKPLEDLFGAINLYTQQPVRVGDYCRFGNVTGTVEEIGLRTTRIRTLGNTVVAIPNSKIAGDVLDNYSQRKRIWFHPKLTIRYDATAAQLRKISAEIEQLLIDHEQLLEDPCRVRLTGFGRDGFEVEIFAYVNTAVWAQYLEIAQELNLAIIEIVERSDTEFAVPFMPGSTP